MTKAQALLALLDLIKKQDQAYAAYGTLTYVQDKGEAGYEYTDGELQAALANSQSKNSDLYDAWAAFLVEMIDHADVTAAIQSAVGG